MNTLFSRTWLLGFLLAGLWISPCHAQSEEELEELPPPWDIENWHLTVAGQTVQVNPDGTFFIPNIPSPDNFGPGGPGTVPDFVGDDPVRLTGVNTAGPVTWYAFSEPFHIKQGETFVVTYLTFTTIPPPFPDSISVFPKKPTITQIGGTSQLTVIGTLGDANQVDLTPRAWWTIYRTSNSDIATVGPNGLVTAHARGTVFLTAINEGATSVTRVDVIPGSKLTTVTGVVQDDEGNPVPGMTVTLLGAAGTTATENDGTFTIEGVTTELDIADVVVRGRGPGGILMFGRGGPLTPVPDGITDAGIILVEPCDELNLDCVDTDSDCIPDAIETAMRLDPLSPDSDNDGTPDGEEDTDGDGFSNCDEVLLGTNPNSQDSDNDGVSDTDEINRFGTDPTNPDTDLDGLNDGDEFVHNTDPFEVDTDRDGFDDATEVAEGLDPLDGTSRPMVQVSSLTSSFLNALDNQIPSNQTISVTSLPVSYLNSYTVPPPPETTISVASLPVSYLNSFQAELPPETIISVGSQPVSYLNGLQDEAPTQATFFSPIVSYENQEP